MALSAVPALYQRRLTLTVRTPRELLVPLVTPVLFAVIIAPALASIIAVLVACAALRGATSPRCRTGSPTSPGPSRSPTSWPCCATASPATARQPCPTSGG
jgi:hypothetical protein